MIIPDKYYKILKWVAIIALPALATFAGTVGIAIGFQNTDLVVLVITALGTLLGTLIGVSNQNYKNKGDE